MTSRILREVVPFNEEDAILAARFHNLSGRRRGTFLDCRIAATAVRSNASLATSNPADFQKLSGEGLRLAP